MLKNRRKMDPGFPPRKPGFRALTKYRKNEALIRNDGVYVISGIFCGAHGGRRLWDGASPRAVRETGEAEVQ